MSHIILKLYTQFDISFGFGFYYYLLHIIFIYYSNYTFVKLFEQFFMIFKNLKVTYYNITKDKYLEIIINYNSGCRKPKSTTYYL